MNINIRPAHPSDIESIFTVRTSVTENHLSRAEMREMGITETTLSDMIEEDRSGLRQMVMTWWVFR